MKEVIETLVKQYSQARIVSAYQAGCMAGVVLADYLYSLNELHEWLDTVETVDDAFSIGFHDLKDMLRAERE